MPSSGLHRRGHLWRRVLTIAAGTVVLVLIASSDRLHGALLELFAAARQVIEIHPWAGRAVFVALAALSAMLAFVSSSLLVPAALVAWGTGQTLALLWLGWVLGGIAAYSAARFLGRPVLELLSRGTPLARWEARIPRQGSFAVALLFQLAVPSEVPGYVLGLLRFPFRRYLAALALGELPFAVGTVALGSGFLGRRTALMVAVGLIGTAASLVAFRLLHRSLQEDRDRPPS